MEKLKPTLERRLLVVFLFLISILLVTTKGKSVGNSCSNVSFKVDCHPDANETESECLKRGCCWLKESDEKKTFPLLEQPNCFFPSDFTCYTIKPITSGQEEKKKRKKKKKKEGEEVVVEERVCLEQERDYSLNDSSDERRATGASCDDERKEEDEEVVHDDKNSRHITVLRWLLTRKHSCPPSGFPDDSKSLQVSLSVHGDSIINIKISEPNKKRFEPSLPDIQLPKTCALTSHHNHNHQDDDDDDDDDDHNKDNLDDHYGTRKLKIGQQLVVELINNSRRSNNKSLSSSSSLEEDLTSASVLKVIHQSSGVILFELDLAKLIYSRQFIQLLTYIPSPFVHGLGQHLGESLLKSSEAHQYGRSYTMFNYGQPPRADDGLSAYSSYPFFINLAQFNYQHNNCTNGNANESCSQVQDEQLNVEQIRSRAETESKTRELIATGALMLNSNAMDILVHSKAGSEGRAGISWRLVGGIIDLYLFFGPEPHEVIHQYQTLVGLPALPPAWALGYHQLRLNYRDTLQMKLAWARTRSAGIPMESIWSDIEFLTRGNSYTLNSPELSELIKILHNHFDMHYVPIVNPAISLREEVSTYEALKLAKVMELFASYSPTNETGESLIAIVSNWAESKQSALIDFTHPQIVDYLKFILAEYKEKLNYDGLWLDMNEPEVFSNELDEDGKECSTDEDIKYYPGGKKLYDRTLCMSAQFHAGNHFDLHNIYAFYQSKAHYEALKLINPNKRPFIISRSQFVGQGKYCGTWLGDLSSNWEHLRWSLIGSIESNWFGQPLVGADICGFFGSTSDELCARWFSLGAFYPFARNHNDGFSKDQDPGALSETVQKVARIALIKRYSLLPYLYSLFYNNHLKGEPVLRSVLFEHFKEFYLTLNLEELPQINDQLMLGPAIMIAPILYPDSQSRSVFLAPGRWYDVSIGLHGTNTDEGVHDSLINNWPVVERNSSKSGLDEASFERLNNLFKPIDCKNRAGCWIHNQQTPLSATNVYMRGGEIIPTFRFVDHTKSIGMMWKNATFFLDAALNMNSEAFGLIYWDDGESDPGSKRRNQAHFFIANNKLVISLTEDYFEDALKFEGFIIRGIKSAPKQSSVIYRETRLIYSYFQDINTLTCVFQSTNDNTTKPIPVVRYDRLTFNW